MIRRTAFLPLLPTLLLLSAAGCRDYQGSDQTEQRHPVLKEARELERTQERAAAAELLHGFLGKNPDFAHAHLQLGMIYQAEEKPVRAIYHFEEYLHARPDTAKAEMLRPLVEDEKKRLSLMYGATAGDGGTDDAPELEAELNRTRRELARARVELQQATLRGGGSGEPPADWAREKLELLREIERLRGTGVVSDVPDPAPSSPAEASLRTYTVQRGDTLGGIARKMYGKASDWRKIHQANRNVLPNERSLDTGMTLVIPE